MAKGGGFIMNMFSAGLGAYAANRSSSVQSLLKTLVKYAAVVIGIMVAVYVVAGVLQRVREGFSVPVAPSKTGDEKMKTPAGNVILY
jgi:hypothetical protein